MAHEGTGAGQSVDGYLRISAARDPKDHLRLTGEVGLARHHPEAVTGVLLVDLEPTGEPWYERLQAGLRYAGESALLRPQTVIVRAYRGTSEALLDPAALDPTAQYIEDRWQQTPTLGVVHLDPGMEACEWAWRGEPPTDLSGLLARARAAEVRALIDWGRAHWRPAGYHYKLASGEHRATFLRLGDAIRQRRDAYALAWWLLPHFLTPNRSLVVDSSSLLPLVLALENQLADEGLALGNVAFRDAYPQIAMEDGILVDHVGGDGIVALLSVSSSGGTRKSLEFVLEERRAPGDWLIETIVSRREANATSWPHAVDGGSGTGTLAPWFHLEDGTEPVDPEEPHLLIDPQTFANTVIPDPATRVVVHPPTADTTHEELLTMYDGVDGIGVECEFDESTALRRGAQRTAIKFYPERLLTATGFLDIVRNRLRTPTATWHDGRPADALDAIRGFDLVVSDEEDHDRPGFREFVQVVVEELGSSSDVRHLSVADDDLPRALADADGVLLVGLGLVTGRSLQRLEMKILGAVGGHARDTVEVSGLVVHGRPASLSEWRSAMSSFNSRLVSLWLTYLPWTSPLQNERRTLSRLATNDPDVEAFVQQRMALIGSGLGDWHERMQDQARGYGLPNPRAILWLPALDIDDAQLPRLLSGSRFGHRASAIATYVGVAAAIHRERVDQEAKKGPPWVQFDLTKMNHTYFETPIAAALLRWLPHHELLWESDGSKDANYLIREMWDQASNEAWDGRSTILAELLLAAAQGKVPNQGFQLLRELVATLQEEFGDIPASLKTGLALLDLATGEANQGPGEAQP